MFGTNVYLSNKAGTFDEEIAAGLPQNPFQHMNTKLKAGYQFRSPNIEKNVWADTLPSLYNTEGPFNLDIVLTEDGDKKTVDAKIWFESKEDAALFAWTNVENWQKWGDAAEKEHQESIKAAKKKPKLKIDKNGKITVTVTATTIEP